MGNLLAISNLLGAFGRGTFCAFTFSSYMLKGSLMPSPLKLSRAFLMGCKWLELAQNLLTSFFANDSILFCKAKVDECEVIKAILEDYELASRQLLNKEKTSLFFSNNTDPVI